MISKRASKTRWIWWGAKAAIGERQIALPAKKIHWYCNWLFVPCTLRQVRTAMYVGVKEGQFAVVRDGGVNLYKNVKR
jgi:hypothetical protein